MQQPEQPKIVRREERLEADCTGCHRSWRATCRYNVQVIYKRSQKHSTRRSWHTIDVRHYNTR